MTEIDPGELIDSAAEADRTERLLRADVDRLTAENRELRQMSEFYDSARAAQITVPTWRREKKGKTAHVGTLMAQLTDWHLDEVVKPEEVLGLNAYDRKIALLRIEQWANKIVSLPRQYMRGVDIEGLIIPSTGDLFTGEIHEELKETNEDALLASVLYWMEPIISLVEMLDSEFPGVEIDCVVGNHGRLNKKYTHKRRVKDNVEWLFWSLVRDRVADRGKAKNTVINVSESPNMNISVYGRNYLLDHGYEFKGGTGISGAFAPLSLGAARKNIRQVVAKLPMHTMIIGHMHQIINIPGVIMGGTLKGYDEYAFNLNLRPDENGAGQAFWVTSPERAQVMWMPIYFDQ